MANLSNYCKDDEKDKETLG